MKNQKLKHKCWFSLTTFSHQRQSLSKKVKPFYIRRKRKKLLVLMDFVGLNRGRGCNAGLSVYRIFVEFRLEFQNLVPLLPRFLWQINLLKLSFTKIFKKKIWNILEKVTWIFIENFPHQNLLGKGMYGKYFLGQTFVRSRHSTIVLRR